MQERIKKSVSVESARAKDTETEKKVTHRRAFCRTKISGFDEFSHFGNIFNIFLYFLFTFLSFGAIME